MIEAFARRAPFHTPTKSLNLCSDLNILNVRRLPARLSREETAFLLRVEPQDIPILIGAKIIRPLGDPAKNRVKWFATISVLRLMEDEKALCRLTQTLHEFWDEKNSKRAGLENDSEETAAPV